MAEKKTSFQINNGIAVSIIAVLLTAAISFNAWAVAAVYDRPTTVEVKDMISGLSPYIRDQSLILSAIKSNGERYTELKKAIDENTRAVIQLQSLLTGTH